MGKGWFCFGRQNRQKVRTRRTRKTYLLVFIWDRLWVWDSFGT